MGQAQLAAPLSRQAYLDRESEQPDRHEYVAGEIFAMVGVRREHAIVGLTLASLLKRHLKGTRCDTFMADMKLFVEAADAYFYPDLMVCCDSRDRQPGLMAVQHPKLVVEVLSDSTAAYDRGPKFSAYRKLKSLHEYLIVDIDSRRLELYRRKTDHWLFYESDAEGLVYLESVELQLGVKEAFEDIDEDTGNPPTP